MAEGQSGTPGRARAEHLDRPLGIGTPRPRLSWTPSGGRSAVSGYEVEASAEDGRTWRERFGPDETVLVPWVGPDLGSRERRSVRVRAVGEGGRLSPWSDPASVEAGLLDRRDWEAQFVGVPDVQGAMPVLRRSFTVGEVPTRARLYAAFHGIGVILINGRPVGDEVLAPGWHSYSHRLITSTHDVTELVRPGRNVLEVRLGDGWYRGHVGFFRQRELYGSDLGVLAQLELTNPDRAVSRIATDASWWWRPGPTLAADIQDGEAHDARLEPDPWDTFPEDPSVSGWQPVSPLSTDLGLLEAPVDPPVRRTGELRPERIFRAASGETIVDFGQNLAGWVRLQVQGPEGTEIILRHAEVLENGELAVEPLRLAEATDRYTLRGDGPESWEPSFTYHGFRYVGVSGWPGELTEDAITAVVVHSDMRRTGWFTTSHPELARLHENVVWSMRGNFVSIPTDCPQRDERLGWTGDIAVFAPTAAYLYDCVGMLQSWLRDLALEQHPNGLVPWFVPDVPFPDHAPDNPLFRLVHTAVWGDAAVLVPFAVYEASGDVEILDRQYESMTRWVDGVEALAGPTRVWDQGFQYGDWLDPTAPHDDAAKGATDPALVATAYFTNSARLVARAAGLLGRREDERRFESLAGEIVAAFRRRFLLGDGRLTSDSQTAYSIALQLNLVREGDERRAAQDRLIQLVRENGHRIGTGFVGTPLILDALTDAGAIDDAYALLLQTELPSWLYAVRRGATTIWERWDSLLPDGTVNPSGMTSFNHYAFGAVAAWLHSTVGGLSSLAPGWRRLRIAPRPHPFLSDAATSHETPFGLASVSWRLADGTLTVEATVPPGTTALVDMHGLPPFEVGPGNHQFEKDWAPQARTNPPEGAQR